MKCYFIKKLTNNKDLYIIGTGFTARKKLSDQIIQIT